MDLMNIILNIIYSVLVLSFLVIIHELGHFFAAKFVKINTLEFGLGYPPTAKKLFRWLKTDFTLNWIPFGGFVRMQGEDEEKEKAEPGDFISASIPGRLLVILAGATVNFIFGIIAFSVLFGMTGIPTPINTARVGQIFPDSPAAQAGVPTDWNVVSVTVDDQIKQVSTIEETVLFIAQHKGQTVNLGMQGPCDPTCGTETKTIENVYIRSEQETPPGEGSLGLAFKDFDLVFYPGLKMVGYSISHGFSHALSMSLLIYNALGQLVSQIFTQGSVPTDITGPIGIVHQSVQLGIFSEGWFGVLSFAGILSVNLAVMNILPILPLDGGKAVMVLLELFFKRKKVFAIEQRLSQVGYVVFLGLLVLVTLKDIIGLVPR